MHWFGLNPWAEKPFGFFGCYRLCRYALVCGSAPLRLKKRRFVIVDVRCSQPWFVHQMKIRKNIVRRVAKYYTALNMWHATLADSWLASTSAFFKKIRYFYSSLLFLYFHFLHGGSGRSTPFNDLLRSLVPFIDLSRSQQFRIDNWSEWICRVNSFIHVFSSKKKMFVYIGYIIGFYSFFQFFSGLF